MIAVFKALLRLVLAMAWLAFGFSFGLDLGRKAFQSWVLPVWAAHYPHHGPLGFAIFGCAFCGGLLGAAVAAVTGYYVLAVFTLPPSAYVAGPLREALKNLDVEPFDE